MINGCIFLVYFNFTHAVLNCALILMSLHANRGLLTRKLYFELIIQCAHFPRDKLDHGTLFTATGKPIDLI
jgi:hypothetical protein